MKNKTKVYLFGPFIGDLSWEILRFAPYAIYLKKENPNIKIIVLTRPERFDLYGKCSNILISLNLKNNEQNCFKMKDFSIDKYQRIIRGFKSKYEKRFEIINHFYPDIFSYRYKLKWQFPRLEMNYNFQPRKKNLEIINKIETEKIIFDDTLYGDSTSPVLISSIMEDHKFVYTNIGEIKSRLNEEIDELNITFIGCMIEILKKSEMVIGNLKSIYLQLALLLGIPVILINEELNEDFVSLINPLKTKILYKEI